MKQKYTILSFSFVTTFFLANAAAAQTHPKSTPSTAVAAPPAAAPAVRPDPLIALESEIKSLLGEIVGIRFQRSAENLLIDGNIGSPNHYKRYKKVMASYLARGAPVIDLVEYSSEMGHELADDMENDIGKTIKKEGVTVKSLSP